MHACSSRCELLSLIVPSSQQLSSNPYPPTRSTSLLKQISKRRVRGMFHAYGCCVMKVVGIGTIFARGTCAMLFQGLMPEGPSIMSSVLLALTSLLPRPLLKLLPPPPTLPTLDRALPTLPTLPTDHCFLRPYVPPKPHTPTHMALCRPILVIVGGRNGCI